MNQKLSALLYSARTAKLIDEMETVLPPLRLWHRFAYQSHFFRMTKWERLFNGVYADYQDARDHIPENLKAGYDNEGSATFLGHKGSVFASDYPILFWLQRLLPDAKKLFDLGGYLGISYFSYEQLMQYPKDLTWQVFDVPAVVDAGRKLAQREERSALKFTTDFSLAEGSDILIAAGSLQMCEQDLADWLRSLTSKPKHILINKLPLTEDEPFATLQNMGPALTPYRVFNRAAFVDSIVGLGYELVDDWQNPDLGLLIPFHPEKTLNTFSGMYLALRGHNPRARQQSSTAFNAASQTISYS